MPYGTKPVPTSLLDAMSGRQTLDLSGRYGSDLAWRHRASENPLGHLFKTRHGETTFQDIKTPVQTPLQLGYLERRQGVE